MKQQDVNMILAVGLIILFVANLFMFLDFIGDSFNFGESGVLVGMMIYGVSFILLIVVSVILLLFVYKKMIGRKILVIASFSLIILLCGFAVNILISAPISGMKIYEYQGESDISMGQTMIYGNYVTWLGDNDVYLLDINDKSVKIIGTASQGPVIYEEKVFFEYDNIIYQYIISTGEKEEIISGTGESLEIYKYNLVWFENQTIYLFNIVNDNLTIIESENMTTPVCISDNYIVWREYGDLLPDEFWKKWFGRIDEGYSNQWTGSGIFNIWIYDISSGEKTKVLSDVRQIIYFNKPVIDVYNNTIAYSNNLSIYKYDISTGESKEIVKHSKINEISGSGQDKTGFIRYLKIYKNIILYGEHYSETFKYDGTNTKYYDITNGNNFELDIWGDDIYEKSIIGWNRASEAYPKELYLVDLDNISDNTVWIFLIVIIVILVFIGFYYCKGKKGVNQDS